MKKRKDETVKAFGTKAKQTTGKKKKIKVKPTGEKIK